MTKYGIAVYYIIAPCEASANLSRYDGVRFGYRSKDVGSLEDLYKRSRGEGFGAEPKRRIILGTYALSSGYYDAYYKKACQVRRLIRDDYEKAFQKCDVIATPVTASPAFKTGEKSSDPLAMYLNDICVRNEFYESIGMDTRKYVDEVLRETNRDAAKAFPVIVNMENPKFWNCLKKCEENNAKLVGIDSSNSPEWLKKIQKLPHLLNNGVQFLAMYLQPSIPAPKGVVL